MMIPMGAVDETGPVDDAVVGSSRWCGSQMVSASMLGSTSNGGTGGLPSVIIGLVTGGEGKEGSCR